MRILMNLDILGSLGGLQLYVTEMATELASRGHEVDLFFREERNSLVPHPSCHLIERVPGFNARLRHPVASSKQLLPTVRAATRSRPDVIYVNRFSDVPYALLASCASRARVVCHLHYFSEHRFTAIEARGVRRFIAVSQATGERWAAAGIDRDRIAVVYNGIKPDVYPTVGVAGRRAARHRIGITDHAYVVLYCGRVHNEKGIDTLVEAWRRLALPPEIARLIVVGEADPVSYRNSLIAQAVSGIEWLPPSNDVVTLMHAADVLVLPSRSEGFPRVVVEAMATGLPVIATRVGGTPEALRGFEDTMVEPNDAVGLASKLALMRRWRQDDPTLGERCARHVRDFFTFGHMADEIERLLAEACDAK